MVIEPRPCPVYNGLDEVGANGASLNEAIENYGVSKPKRYDILKTELEK